MRTCVRACVYTFNLPLKGQKVKIGIDYLSHRNVYSLANEYIDIIKIHVIRQ